jgi:hypothetical protein
MNKIAAALVKAQKSFAPALKTNTNPHFRSKYVGLDGCVEAVIDALNENGIYLMQSNHEADDGVIVETVFIHESGETVSAGKLHVPASKLDAQGFGSALTYARRYSLMAACGIAPEDDDGNAASKSNVTQMPDRTTKAQLPKLTDEEAERVYNKWQKAKELLVDDEGDPDQIKIADAWGRLPSNVRTAIKRWGEAVNQAAQLDQQAQQHISDIARG